MGMDSSGVLGAIRKRPWTWLLGLLMALSAVLLLVARSRLGFLLDDWALVISRHTGGVGDFLDPHNEHIIVLPVALYKASLGLFGMEAMPLQVLAVATFLASVGLLYDWIRTEVGEPLAVIGCAVVLFLGCAWEDLLWAFQIGFFGSVAAGIGALLLARRDDRRGDLLACLLLGVSILFSSLGIPFVAAAFAGILLAPRAGGPGGAARRLWVVALPALLYVGWWLGWGHTASDAASLENALHVPRYVLSALGLATAEATGIYRALGPIRPEAMLALGIVAVAAFALLFRRRRRIPAPFVVAAVAALAFWGLAGLNVTPGRDFGASRYQYPSVVLLLMMVAGACSGMRPRREVAWGLGLVAVAAIAVNLTSLQQGYRDTMKPLYEKGIAGLTALDIARGTVNPDYAVGVDSDETALINTGSWFEAQDRDGEGVAWTEEEAEGRDEDARRRIDEVLIQALPVTSGPASEKTWRRSRAGDRCVSVAARPEGSPAVPVSGRSVLVRAPRDVAIAAARFGDEAVPFAIGPGGRATLVTFPADRSSRPWRVTVLGRGEPTAVCAVRPR